MDLPGQLHKMHNRYFPAPGSRGRGARTVISSGTRKLLLAGRVDVMHLIHRLAQPGQLGVLQAVGRRAHIISRSRRKRKRAVDLDKRRYAP